MGNLDLWALPFGKALPNSPFSFSLWSLCNSPFHPMARKSMKTQASPLPPPCPSYSFTLPLAYSFSLYGASPPPPVAPTRIPGKESQNTSALMAFSPTPQMRRVVFQKTTESRSSQACTHMHFHAPGPFEVVGIATNGRRHQHRERGGVEATGACDYRKRCEKTQDGGGGLAQGLGGWLC